MHACNVYCDICMQVLIDQILRLQHLSYMLYHVPQADTQLTIRAMQVVAVLVTLLTLGHPILTEYFVTSNESTPCPAMNITSSMANCLLLNKKRHVAGF